MSTITVRSQGPGLTGLARAADQKARKANRDVGKRVAKVGRAAAAKDAPRMFGKKLGVKTRNRATAARSEIEIYGSPAGGWAIAESGARGHVIRPRKAKVLHTGGDRFGMSADHPGARGRHAWTDAGQRVEPAVAKEIKAVYDEAFR